MQDPFRGQQGASLIWSILHVYLGLQQLVMAVPIACLACLLQSSEFMLSLNCHRLNGS